MEAALSSSRKRQYTIAILLLRHHIINGGCIRYDKESASALAQGPL